jgi:hypothetical protein
MSEAQIPEGASAPVVRKWCIRFVGEVEITGTADEVFRMPELLDEALIDAGFALTEPVRCAMAPTDMTPEASPKSSPGGQDAGADAPAQEKT